MDYTDVRTPRSVQIVLENGLINLGLKPFSDIPEMRSYFDERLGEKPAFMFDNKEEITVGQILEQKLARDLNIVLVLPAKNEGQRIAATLDRLWPLVVAGIVDTFMVVDATPEDGTREAVGSRGDNRIEYVDERQALNHYRNVLSVDFGINVDDLLGKGTALALSVLAHHQENDLIFFVDVDIAITPEQVLGMMIPVIHNPTTELCVGAFDRSTLAGNESGPKVPGARVTRFASRPAENVMHSDSLGGESFEPLGGAYGGRALSMAIAEVGPNKGIFSCSYAVETTIGNYYRAQHIDANSRSVTPKKIYQEVFLGPRHQTGQSDSDLSHMACAVIRGNLEGFIQKHNLGVELGETVYASNPVVEVRSDGYAYAVKRCKQTYLVFPPLTTLIDHLQAFNRRGHEADKSGVA